MLSINLSKILGLCLGNLAPIFILGGGKFTNGIGYKAFKLILNIEGATRKLARCWLCFVEWDLAINHWAIARDQAGNKLSQLSPDTISSCSAGDEVPITTIGRSAHSGLIKGTDITTGKIENRASNQGLPALDVFVRPQKANVFCHKNAPTAK